MKQTVSCTEVSVNRRNDAGELPTTSGETAWVNAILDEAGPDPRFLS